MIAWGTSYYGEAGAPPPPPPGLGYVAIAAGVYHNAALRSDGNVVAWGLNIDGQCNVLPPPSGLSYTAVACGGSYIIVRRSDGAVLVFGAAGVNGQGSPPPAGAGLAYAQIEGRSPLIIGRFDVGAAVVTVGSGCGGAGSPSFSCNPPRLGQLLALGLTQATPAASGFLYSSGIPAAPIALGAGCTAAVDLATFAPFTPVAADPTGSWGRPWACLPTLASRASNSHSDRALPDRRSARARPQQRAARHGLGY